MNQNMKKTSHEKAQEKDCFGAEWVSNSENFPRKQFKRQRWCSLNGEWDFYFDDKCEFSNPYEFNRWNKKILVPFAPESKASGIGDTGFHPRIWYKKEFSITTINKDKKYFLHFGAVDYEAKVWLNGFFLGQHTGGHTSFSFDITPHIKGDLQTLIVCADDDPVDLAKPRGKQDWQVDPHIIWYHRTSGIWQTVWIEEVPQVHVDRIRWTPLVERFEIGFEAFVCGDFSLDLKLRVRLRVGEKILADDTYQVIHHEVHRRVAISDPGIDDYRNEILWSPEKPTLIYAEIFLLDGNEVIDQIDSYTALRSISVQRGRFLLNGRPYYLKMVLNQGYWQDSLMTAPDPQAQKKDVELIKSAGFNGVRLHQKIEDPDFLYWADHLGLIVWGEMPSCYRFTHEAVERTMKEWMEFINRDSNHPCIGVWVPYNESWGVPDLAEKEAHRSCVLAAYHLTRTLDPTRLVVGNDGWESTATDILGIHDYDDQPERIVQKYASTKAEDVLGRKWPGGRMLTVEGYPHQGQPIMLTEFGGIACNLKSNGHTWGYSSSKSAQEFQNRYQNLMQAVHSIEIFSGFCYTQFTDTFQEANGLFTMDRKPKFSLAAMARATRNYDQTRGELTSSPMPAPFPPLEEPNI